MEEEAELVKLREMLGRDERLQGSREPAVRWPRTHTVGASLRAGPSTDRFGAHAVPTGRSNHRAFSGGNGLYGGWNASPYKPAPYALRGLTPLDGLSQNEPWSPDVLDTAKRLNLAPSSSYATASLSRLDDGQYDDIAMLHRRKARENLAASTATKRPPWNPASHRDPPASLRGLKPVTPEPWPHGEFAVYQKRKSAEEEANELLRLTQEPEPSTQEPAAEPAKEAESSEPVSQPPAEAQPES